MFGDPDRAGAERSRSDFDLQGDAAHGYDEAVFRQRFLDFRFENAVATRS